MIPNKEFVIPFSKYHDQQKLKYLIKLLTTDLHTPHQTITFNASTLQPIKQAFQKSCHSRTWWYMATLEIFWKIIFNAQFNPELADQINATLDLSNEEHRDTIFKAAKEYFPFAEDPANLDNAFHLLYQ